jgi:hypothetical protein
VSRKETLIVGEEEENAGSTSDTNKKEELGIESST